jgi:hypothetical protein
MTAEGRQSRRADTCEFRSRVKHAGGFLESSIWRSIALLHATNWELLFD